MTGARRFEKSRRLNLEGQSVMQRKEDELPGESFLLRRAEIIRFIILCESLLLHLPFACRPYKVNAHSLGEKKEIRLYNKTVCKELKYLSQFTNNRLLYLYRARSKITHLSIPTHAQLRHRLKFIKNHIKTPTCFGLRPSSGSYNVLAKITII